MLYNSQPRPRALLINFTEEDSESKDIANMFPTHKIIAEDELRNVRQAEYDLAIILEPAREVEFEYNLNVITVGGTTFRSHIANGGYVRNMVVRSYSVSTEFIIDNDLPEDIHKLVKDTLLPIVKQKSNNPVLSAYAPGGTLVKNIWLPMLKDGDDRILAGYFTRKQGASAEYWYFPVQVQGKTLGVWLHALLKRWAENDPQTFSLNSDWRTHPEWQSPNEVKLHTTISNESELFRKQQESHLSKLTDLTDQLKLERLTADQDHRSILTTQGTELKDKVGDVFKGLGFKVEDRDEGAKPGDLLEDLRVETKYEGKEWVALVEVRGYKKGAQLSDLFRISRFTKRYMRENNGAPPDAAWYVVNHDLRTDPGARQLALWGNEKEVQAFTEAENGLILDTTCLFKLRIAVEKGEIKATDARKLLINGSGVFRLDE